MKSKFNSNVDLLRIRPAPHLSIDLATRIIEASKQPSAQAINIGMLFVFPRPAMVISLLFVLSLFAGVQFDMGFNIPEDAYISAQDILFSFNEEDL